MKLQPLLPEAKKGSTSITGDTIAFDAIEVPAGKTPEDLNLDFTFTTSGTAGTGTSYGSRLIKEIIVRNEDKVPVIKSHGQAAVGVLCFLLAALAVLSGEPVLRVVNDDVLAGSSTYYANFLFRGRFKAKKLVVQVTLEPVSVLGGYTTVPTGLTTTIGVSGKTSDKPAVPAKYKGLKLASQTSYSADCFAALVAIDNTDLVTNLTGLGFAGSSYNNAQIGMLESLANYFLRGAGADGSQNPVPGVLSPESTNALYAAIFSDEDIAHLSVVCASSTLLIGRVDPYNSKEE